MLEFGKHTFLVLYRGRNVDHLFVHWLGVRNGRGNVDHFQRVINGFKNHILER